MVGAQNANGVGEDSLELGLRSLEVTGAQELVAPVATRREGLGMLGSMRRTRLAIAGLRGGHRNQSAMEGIQIACQVERDVRRSDPGACGSPPGARRNRGSASAGRLSARVWARL